MRVKWLIERKTVLGFGLAFALISVAGVVSYRSLRHHDETSRLLAHTHKVLANLESGLIDLLNIQTSMRGFVLTGMPEYLQPYEHALPRIPVQLDRLRQLTADDPRQQKRLDRLDLLVPQFLAHMKLRLEIRQRLGFNAAGEQVASGKGKRLMDDIRAVFAEMEEEERQLLVLRTEAASASARQAILVSSISSLLATLLFGYSFLLIRRQIFSIQQAELRTRDARVFSESIVDTVRSPLLVLGSDLRVVSANHSFYQFFQVSEAETLGQFLFDLGAGQWNIPGLRDLLETVLPHNTHLNDIEVEHDFPKIGRRTMLLNARKLYREGNHTNQVLLAIEDVTERMRVESTLAALLEAAPDAMVVTDDAGRIVRINAQTEKLFGYSREELLGQQVEALIPVRFRDHHVAHWQRYSARPYVRAMANASALFALRKDGSEFLVEISLGPVDTPGGNLVIAAIRDITARKQAEEALALSQERYRNQSRLLKSIVDCMGDGLIVADEEGEFLLFNPAAERILGAGPNGGGPEVWTERYQLFLPDGATPFPPAELPLARAMRGEVADAVEMVVRPPLQLEPIWISVTARPLTGADNKKHGGVAVFRDITAAKQAAHSLEEAKQAAERATNFKNQFLSTMSHELRTPLNAVLGFSELLTDETYGPLNDRQRRYLGHIQNGGHHLVRLINDVLDLSRIEAGRMDLVIENLAIEPIVAEALETIRALADQKSLVVSHSIPPGLVVRADSTRLRQILLNLLANAVKFTPQGGCIELNARREMDAVRIEVRDSGPGIPSAEQAKIFQAFYRMRKSGAEPEGTGLGLAITQRLVEIQGGKLGLESEVGKGSCFFCSFPAADAVCAPTLPKLTPAEPHGESPLVLVVEDDPVSIHLIQTQLAWAGYRVAICDDSQRAFQMAVDLLPAAITLDILMKPITGWEVLAQLHGDPRTKDIPLIVTSVMDQRGTGISLGAEEYLVKPIQKKVLLAAIERCFDRRGASVPVRPILVVEDDAAAREVISEVLSAQGYTVATAEDGQQARAMVASTLPELVLLDLVLPNLSGFELLAEWRANPRTSGMPVFVLSGKELTGQEREYLRLHSELLLRKQEPWHLTLLDQLRRVLAIGPGANA